MFTIITNLLVGLTDPLEPSARCFSEREYGHSAAFSFEAIVTVVDCEQMMAGLSPSTAIST